MQIVGGVVGGVIGFMIGGPAGAQMGYMAGSMIGGMLGPQQKVYGPKLDDKKLVTSQYGNSINRLYGTQRCSGEVLWQIDLEEEEVEQSAKGGGPTQVNTYYYGTFALGLCEGEIEGIRRIWANGELVYDVSGSIPKPSATLQKFVDAIEKMNGHIASTDVGRYMRVYTGSEDQLPDPTIQSHDPNTSAYRGLAYIVFTRLPMEKYGNRMPNFMFETVKKSVGSAYDAYPVIASIDTVLSGDLGVNVTATVDRDEFDVVELIRYSNLSSGARAERYAVSDGGTPRYIYNMRVGSEGYPSNGTYASVTIGCPKAAIGYRMQTGFGKEAYAVALRDYETRAYFRLGDEPAYAATFLIEPVMAYDGISLAALSGASMTNSGSPTATKIFVSDKRAFAAAGPVTGLFIESGYLYVLQKVGTTTVQLDVYDLSSTATTPAKTASMTSADFVHGSTRSPCLYVCDGNSYVLMSATGNTTTWGEQTIFRANVLGGDTTLSATKKLFNANLVGIDEVPNRWNLNRSTLGGSARFFAADGVTALVPVIDTEGTAPRPAGIARVAMKLLADGGTTVAEIVKAECALGGLLEEDLDVSELESIPIAGFQVANSSNVAQNLQPLADYAFFDAVEVDWKILFAVRNRVPTIVIPEDDGGAAENKSTESSALTWARVNETELPQEVSVAFIDSTAGYATNTKYARRLSTNSKSKLAVQMAIVMTPDEGQAIASRTLANNWTSANKGKLKTSIKYTQLVPTDAVYVEQNGRRFAVRLLNRADDPSGMIEWDVESMDARVIDQVGVAQASTWQAPSISYAGAMDVELLDLPLLRDVDNYRTPLFYAGALPARSEWSGGSLWASDTGGSDFARATNFDSRTHVGTVLSALPAWSWGSSLFDDVNSVQVQFYEEVALAGVTREQALSLNYNLAMLGSELVVFKNAVLTGGTSSAPIYTLSGFLRAQKGTEASMATHVAREHFVLLNIKDIEIVRIPSAQVGVTRTYKAVSNGRSLQSARSLTFAASKAAVKPLSPVFVAAGRTAAGGMNIQWQRRSRIDQAWRDYGDVELGETSEAYEIDIFTGAGVFLRTLYSNTTSVSYSPALVSLDFTSYPASFQIKVHQVSSVCGRGDAGTYTQ